MIENVAWFAGVISIEVNELRCSRPPFGLRGLWNPIGELYEGYMDIKCIIPITTAVAMSNYYHDMHWNMMPIITRN